MANIQTLPTPQELLHEDAATAHRWIVEHQTLLSPDSDRFNWLGLAEIAAARATEQARGITKPRQHFPAAQQTILALALQGEPFGADHPSRAAKAWLDKALPALGLARIAITTYHFLADTEPTAKNSNFIHSAMHVRSYLIGRLGPLQGSDILDPEIVTRWFFTNLSLTPAEARDLAAWSKQQFREEVRSPKLGDTLRQLRRIKNALSPINSLVTNGDLQPSPILAEWLAVRESLP